MNKHGRTEAAIMREIQAEATDANTRLWRLNVGTFLLADGRRITVGTPGMSDLIGLRSVVVTPEMVGRRIAIFCAVEVKRPDVRSRPAHQVAFIDAVSRMGGRAGFADSVNQAANIVGGTLDLLSANAYSSAIE